MTLLIVYLLMMTGPVAGAAFMNRRSGFLLPLTALLSVAVLYTGALCGALEASVSVLCAAALLLWIASLIRVIRRRSYAAFCQRLLTPMHAVYTAFFAFCAFGARGMQVHTWDEFSHWAYSVQEMLLNGELYTAAVSDDLYKHYPPMMPLWQYLGQRIHTLLTGDKAMASDVLYAMSPAFGLVMLTPFMSRLTWKKPHHAALALFGMLGLPLIVYTDYYQLLYIDGFLGLLAGAVFAMVALKKWHRPLGAVLLALMEAALILTKESGLFFAAVSLAYLAVQALCEKNKKLLPAVALIVVTATAAYVSWQVHLRALQITSSGTGVDLHVLWNLMLGRDDSGYRYRVIGNFLRFLFTDYFRVTLLGVPVTYFLSIVLLIAASVMALRTKGESCRALLAMFCAVCAVAYLVGLLLLYLFHFGEYGGLSLLSAGRYTKNLVLCLAALLAACLLNGLGKMKMQPAVCVLLAVMLLLPSWDEAYAHISGQNARETREAASEFRAAAELICEKTQDDAQTRKRVYLILQENDDHFYYGLRYYARPCAEVNWLNWHLGEKAYSEAYNVWAVKPDEWAQTLQNSYDYVYVGSTDEYFCTQFAHLFDGDIAENSVYAVEASEGGVTLVKQ